MLKDKATVIGIGLAGETVGMDFQIRNYTSYLMNGSTQDNQTLTGAKNIMVLEGYDGLLDLWESNRDRKVGKCEICAKKFVVVGNSKTCSDKCSKVLVKKNKNKQ